jgi:hypothetical protein
VDNFEAVCDFYARNMVVGKTFGEKEAKAFHYQDKKIGGERAPLSEPP